MEKLTENDLIILKSAIDYRIRTDEELSRLCVQGLKDLKNKLNMKNISYFSGGSPYQVFKSEV